MAIEKDINPTALNEQNQVPLGQEDMTVAMDANRCPESTNMLSSDSRVPLGSLKGRGCIESLSDPPGASTSLNSPGCIGVSSSLILIPLVLKPAGKFANVPASISCLMIEVDAFDRPPIMCVKPNP